MKKALCLMLALCLCFLPGCHGKKKTSAFAVPAQLDAERQFEITFWAKNDTNKTQTKIYETAIANFEALYPNICVTLRLYTDYNRIYNDVITNIPTNTTPNVCITYPDHIATYLTGQDAVVPLSSLFANESYGLGGTKLRFSSPTQEEIVPKFLEECRIKDDYYAIPFMRSTEALYVNKTLVEALGYTLPETVTWDFIWEVSQKAAEQDEEGTYLLNGQKVMLPFIYKSTDNMMIQMLRQKNAGYSDTDGNISIFNDTTKDILLTVAENTNKNAFSTFKISGYPANFLNAGQCVFAIDSTAGATWMGTYAPHSDISEEQLVEFETAVLPIPQFDPMQPAMISQGPSVCVFNKEDPQEVLASWLFAQYLLTNEVQLAYAQTEGYIPVTKKAQEDPLYIDYLENSGKDNDRAYSIKIAASKLLLANIDNTFVTPVFNGSASLRNAAGQLIESTVKSVRRKEQIDDAYIENLYAQTTSLYRLDQIGTSPTAFTEPLPTPSVLLLTILGGTWAVMLAYVLCGTIKNRRKKH
ncbi:MAG: extracellular solute-binding protein [Clostridia bacterium]|nr:extracellular solute-binding protein [Clostridia bacterium]